MTSSSMSSIARPSASSWTLPEPGFAHLEAMTAQYGLWEHARLSAPRPEHGFCNDDNARALVVMAHEGTADLAHLTEIYLWYVLDSRGSDGTFRNRRDSNGSWIDEAGSDDSQGRVLWGLGAIAADAPSQWMKETALDAIESVDGFVSPHLRANAYAALGAAEVIAALGDFQPAVELLDRTTATIFRAARSATPWPEPRLSYDNARLPEALLAAGSGLGDERRTDAGIRLLQWLVANETTGGRFSFTPVGGRAPGALGPSFDQQPIEAWAMADACNRAFLATGRSRWHDLAMRAGSWLLGENDSNAVMYDQKTGATYDGLTVAGVNLNRGAESTLAGLGVLQVAARLRSGSA